MKRGRLSNEEIQYIKDNVHYMNYVQIATNLDRDPESIRSHIEKKLGLETSLRENTNPVNQSGYEYDLEQEQVWEVLQEQFTPEELSHFKYQWNQFHDQFGGDVLPTEKLQIIDAIRLDILMSSNLRAKKKTADNINDLEINIMAEKHKLEQMEDPTPQDKFPLLELEKNLSFARAAQGEILKDYRELQDRKNRILTALKGTRRDRIQRIESGRESFPVWMAEVVSNPEKRRQLGIEMEKRRLAAIDEEIRLQAYHKYENGQIDQPLLNCDTVKPDNGKKDFLSEPKEEDNE